MGQSDRHPDRRSCLLPSGLDMTWPLEHFLTASARACDRLFGDFFVTKLEHGARYKRVDVEADYVREFLGRDKHSEADP